MDLKPLFPGILALGLALAGPASGNAGAGTRSMSSWSFLSRTPPLPRKRAVVLACVGID